MKLTILTVFPLLGASLLSVTSAVPVVGNHLLARDYNTTEDVDWIAPSIVSIDLYHAEHNGNGKRSGLDSRDTSTSLSGLGGCLQQKVSGWPKNKPSKEQFNECAKQQGLGVSLKRGDPTSPQAPTAPSADGDTLSGVCEIANVILTNFLTDVDMKKLAHDICDGAVTYGTGFVTSDLGAIPSLFTLQGGRKKGLTIAHNNRQVQLVATVANIAGINAKSTLVDLCVQAITYQAETCTTELKYGAFEAKVAHVQKASTSTWRDASGAVQAIFDFGFGMPGTFTFN